MSTPPVMIDPNHYRAPDHGWTCFHCGETFHAPAEARAHFGFDPSCDPACRIKSGEERGLVRALRAVERKYRELLEATCSEQGQVASEFYRLGSEHSTALRRAEQDGYDKGLADGRKMAAERKEAR